MKKKTTTHPTVTRLLKANPEHIKKIKQKLMVGLITAHGQVNSEGVTGWKEAIPLMDTNPDKLWTSGALSAVQGLLSELINNFLDDLEKTNITRENENDNTYF